LDEEEEVRSARSHNENPITLKARQSLINVEQSFGLPIRKPALYKRSRTVTRNAEEALHSIPFAQAEKYLLPGNIVWTALFGWWLSLAFLAVSAVLYLILRGGESYMRPWCLGWVVHLLAVWEVPRGRPCPHSGTDDKQANGTQEGSGDDDEDTPAPRGHEAQSNYSISQNAIYQRVSTSGVVSKPNEGISLLSRWAVANVGNQRSYSAVPAYSVIGLSKQTQQWFLEKQRFWLFLLTITAPLLIIVSML
jgi:Ca2+:H+ antiporter